MNRRERIRRQWTHRRLGLDAARPGDAELARTELLLTAVGARKTAAGGFTADSFDAALFDFVCDVDLSADIATTDAQPIPVAVLRAARPATRRPRLSWRVLIPAATSGVAAITLTVAALTAEGTPSTTSPTLNAAAESRQLLTHAERLLTAAGDAATKDRATLLTEAKADLSHVSRLLPLTAPQARPGIRDRMAALSRRADAPRASAGNGGASDTHSSTPTSPARSRPVRQRPPATDGVTGQDGPTSRPANPATTLTPPAEHTGSGEAGPTQPERQPQPPPTSGTRQPPPSGSTDPRQQPPPGGGAPPPRQ